MSNKVVRKVYARFSSRFSAHSRTPPLLLSNKNEDPSSAVNLSGLQRVIMGLTSIRTQSSFILGHRADSWKRKKKFTIGKTPVHSTSALLLMEGRDGQSYDSLLLVSQKSQKTDLNDLVEHTASLLPSLTRYISDDDRYLVSAFFGCHWLYSDREETGKCSAGETPSCG